MAGFLQEARRRLRRLTVGLVIGLVALMIVFAGVKAVLGLPPGWGSSTSALLTLAIAALALWRFLTNLRCPGCHRTVSFVALNAPEQTRCPHCGADWTRDSNGA